MNKDIVPRFILNLDAFGVREPVFRPISSLLATIQTSREKIN